MKHLRTGFSTLFLLALVFGCIKEQPVCGCVFPESPLKGDWNLTKITFGLTQKTITPQEAGYTETLSFLGNYTGDGKLQQIRNGVPTQITDYTMTFPNGGNSEGVLYFRADTTQQSFRLATNTLYLSERTRQGVVLADGATYEYSR